MVTLLLLVFQALHKYNELDKTFCPSQLQNQAIAPRQKTAIYQFKVDIASTNTSVSTKRITTL